METKTTVRIDMAVTPDEAWYIHQSLHYSAEYDLNRAIEYFGKGDTEHYLKALDRSRAEEALSNYFKGKVARHDFNVAVGDDIKDVEHPWESRDAESNVQ